MRQRLLLVAGWVLAAVGTSVVASAAVAATGGQVTDRALRPLSAAEVAALPGGFLEVLSESLASGDSSDTGLGESREGTTIVPATQPPAGAGGVTAPTQPPLRITFPPSPPIDDDPAPVEEPDPATPLDSLPIQTHIEHVIAGSASFVGAEAELRLLWVTPNVGWQFDVEFVDEGRIVISFADGTSIWTIDAELVDDVIEVVTKQIAAGPR